MTQQEIKDKIADLEKKSKNPSLPASAVAKLDKMIDDLKGQLEKEPKAEPKAEAKKKAEPKAKSKAKAKKSPPKRTKAEKTEKDCDELIEREEKAHGAGYDVDELLKTAKDRKAKSKARATAKKNEPKKKHFLGASFLICFKQSPPPLRPKTSQKSKKKTQAVFNWVFICGAITAGINNG